MGQARLDSALWMSLSEPQAHSTRRLSARADHRGDMEATIR